MTAFASERVLGRRPSTRTLSRACAAVILLVLAAFCWHFNAPPRHKAFAAVPDTVRALAATVVVFGIGGFGLVRLLLPEPLRRYELLWVLPTGGCAVGLALTVLGFAGLPYAASLPLVLVAGLGLGAYAVNRRGWPELTAARLGWPLFLAWVVLTVALIPLLFHQHFDAPIGTGSDAHVAAGVAQFLKHTYPTGINLHEPINQMQPTWQSKYPIYYAFASVSTISALPTWQVLAPLAAALLALAAVGMFLMALEVFRVPTAFAFAAMGLAGLDRMAIYTALNPYFNQTWGYFALPFTVTLGWIAVQPELDPRARRGTVVLLAIFALVLVLAYPLAAPIPAVPLLAFWLVDRRRRLRAGGRVLTLRGLYRGRWSLIWMVPLAVALAFPIEGAVHKAIGAAEVLAPGHSLQDWAGDLGHFIPFAWFFSLPGGPFGFVLFAGLAALAIWGLANQPRALAAGLGGLLLLGILLAVYLRQRQYGYYFHFKLLAFIGPVMLVIAAAGAARLRQLGIAALVVLSGFTAWSVLVRLSHEGYQLPEATVQLSNWTKALPRGASVRLDMEPGEELWAAYFLDARPLCSPTPLLGTDYPHVVYSRKADYIVTINSLGRPVDAIGRPLRRNQGYTLYRENPAVPGPSYCTYRRYDRIYGGLGYSRY